MNLAKARGFVSATCEGVEVIPPTKVATNFWLRAMGLMGKKAVPEAYGAGLFFPKCGMLHTFFMRFPLDVMFLDEEGRVLVVVRRVQPWKIVVGPAGSRHCMEVAGEFAEWDGPLVWDCNSGAPA